MVERVKYLLAVGAGDRYRPNGSSTGLLGEEGKVFV